MFSLFFFVVFVFVFVVVFSFSFLFSFLVFRRRSFLLLVFAFFFVVFSRLLFCFRFFFVVSLSCSLSPSPRKARRTSCLPRMTPCLRASTSEFKSLPAFQGHTRSRCRSSSTTRDSGTRRTTTSCRFPKIIACFLLLEGGRGGQLYLEAWPDEKQGAVERLRLVVCPA